MGKLMEKALGELSPSTSIFKVLTYLSFKGASLPSQVSEETGIPPGTVRPALRALLEKGYVVQKEGGAYTAKIAFTDIIADLYTRYGKKS